MEFEKIVEFNAGFDKRDSNPSKNYGIHDMMIRFTLKGKKGAIYCAMGTSWYPIKDESKRSELASSGGRVWDVGYHSPNSSYEEQSICLDSCPHLDGKPCYSDTWVIDREKLFREFIEGGDKVIWNLLEEKYNEKFAVLAGKSVDTTEEI